MLNRLLIGSYETGLPCKYLALTALSDFLCVPSARIRSDELGPGFPSPIGGKLPLSDGQNDVVNTLELGGRCPAADHRLKEQLHCYDADRSLTSDRLPCPHCLDHRVVNKETYYHVHRVKMTSANLNPACWSTSSYMHA